MVVGTRGLHSKVINFISLVNGEWQGEVGNIGILVLRRVCEKLYCINGDAENGSESIFCVNVCIAIDTMLNFDGDANADLKCE